MRSTSPAIRSALTTVRRSLAMGWRNASRAIACSSISRSIASTLWSVSTTLAARSASRLMTAWMAPAIWPSATPPIRAIMLVRRSSCSSKDLTVCSFAMGRCPRSAEATGDIVFGLFLVGMREDDRGLVELDQLAQIHEGGVVGGARRLLHVVGDDRDAVLVAQLADQLLDLCGRDRVEGRR